MNGRFKTYTHFVCGGGMVVSARSLPPTPAAKGGHPSLRGGESELFLEDSCIVCPFAATPPCEEGSMYSKN